MVRKKKRSVVDFFEDRGYWWLLFGVTNMLGMGLAFVAFNEGWVWLGFAAASAAAFAAGVLMAVTREWELDHMN